MINVVMSDEQVAREINKVIDFTTECLKGCRKIVIGVSGGLDSDVVVRLATKLPNIEIIKLFIVIQDDMENHHIDNARNLAKELNLDLAEIDLAEIPMKIITAMQKGDKNEKIIADGLDGMKMKCSLRTPIFSTYQDHGFVVLGTSNRTEYETGFFLPFGDGLSHIKPIIHLYKSQIRQLAIALGTKSAVLEQPASAGFWKGEEDLEDLAWWLHNGGRILNDTLFTKKDESDVIQIRGQLTTERVDLALLGISMNLEENLISDYTSLPIDIIRRFNKLVCEAQILKHRAINKALPPYKF